MTRPIHPKTIPTRVRGAHAGVYDERRKPVIPGPYIYVGDFVNGVPSVVTWQSPPWLNNWTWVDPYYVGFRHGVDGETEFTGVVDTTQGAISGTTAFVLPVEFRPRKTFSFITDLDLGGGSFSAARVLVETTGNVKIYFPISV